MGGVAAARGVSTAGCASSAVGSTTAHTEGGSTQIATKPHTQTTAIAAAVTRIQCQNCFTTYRPKGPSSTLLNHTTLAILYHVPQRPATPNNQT